MLISYVLQSIGYCLYDLGDWLIKRGDNIRKSKLDRQYNYLAHAGEDE